MAYNVDENPQTIYTLDEEAIAPSVPDKPVPEFTIEFYIQPRFYIQPWHESPEEILKMLSQQIEGCDRLIQQCAGILSTGYDATIEQDLISTEEMRDRLVRIQIVCTSCHKLIHHQRTYLGHEFLQVGDSQDGAA